MAIGAAPEITLARVRIDPSGVVEGVEEQDRALSQSEDRFQRHSREVDKGSRSLDVFGARFLNLRNIAFAALGGFTVAGAVFQIVNLTKEVISSSDAFKDLKKNATDLFNELVKGETAVDRFYRNLGEESTEAGLTLEGGTFSKQVKALLELRGEIIREAASVPGAEFGADIVPVNLQVDFQQIERALMSMRDRFVEFGFTADEFEVAFGVRIPSALQHGLDDAKHRLLFLNDEVEHGDITIQQYEARVESLTTKLKALGATALQLKALGLGEMFMTGGPTLGGVVPGGGFSPDDIAAKNFMDAAKAGGEITEEFIGPMQQQIQLTEDLTTAYERLGIVVDATGSLMAAAANAGIISQSAAARLSMAIVSVQSVQQGIFELAAAAAATARYDFGAATLHKIASGLYFAAAAINFGAAVSGGGQASGGGAGSFGRPSSGPLGPQDQPRGGGSVTIYFYGPVVGGSADEIARMIAKRIQRQRQDGART